MQKGDNNLGAMPPARATHEPSQLRRLGLLVGIAIALAGCNPSSGTPVPMRGTGESNLGSAKLSIWRDPTTGCRYFVYREGVTSNAVGSLSIRYRRDGRPDCPPAKSEKE